LSEDICREENTSSAAKEIITMGITEENGHIDELPPPKLTMQDPLWLAVGQRPHVGKLSGEIDEPIIQVPLLPYSPTSDTEQLEPRYFQIGLRKRLPNT
jgi:hypothetical protein